MSDNSFDQTDDTYQKHYSVLVPRNEGKVALGDYFRYGTKNGETNFDNGSIEAKAVSNITAWAPDAGKAGILQATTDDFTAVYKGDSYQFTQGSAFLYYGEKNEVVGDENRVEGVRRLFDRGQTDTREGMADDSSSDTFHPDVLSYDISATLSYEAQFAAKWEFDASLAWSFKAGYAVEASYGLKFESGIGVNVKVRSDKEYEFTGKGQFESKVEGFAHFENYTVVADDNLAITIMPGGVINTAWQQLMNEAYSKLAVLTHALNAAYAANAAISVARMKTIQKDASEIDPQMVVFMALGAAQSVLGLVWIVVGAVHESKLKTWMGTAANVRTRPYLTMDHNRVVRLGTGGNAVLELNGDDATLTANTLTLTGLTTLTANANGGNATINSPNNKIVLNGNTGIDLAAAAGPVDIRGTSVTSNGGAGGWTHTGAFNAPGQVTLGTVNATSINVGPGPGTAVATSTDVANVSTSVSSLGKLVQTVGAFGSLPGSESTQLSRLLLGLRSLPF